MAKLVARHYHRFDIYTTLRYYSGFGRCDDDFIDRLSRQYSVLIFSVFILIVSCVQLVGKPISCFTPASFTAAHMTYADLVCWISETYFVSNDEEIPEIDASNMRQGSHIIRFYQYVPFVLILQTCGFFLPGFVWRVGSFYFGVPLQKYLDQLNLSRRSLTQSPAYRRQLIRNVALHLNRYFRARPRTFVPTLTLFYLFVKLIYLVNILVQLICLHNFMNFDFNIKDILRRFIIYSNTVRHESLQFPTNVLCDFIVRFLGKNRHRHTVQCVLPINVFNEKIFIFSYLWLSFLFICTLYNIIVQWFLYFVSNRNVIYIHNRLRHSPHTLSKFTLNHNEYNDAIKLYDQTSLTNGFTQHYLQCDGLLIVRLLDLNTDLVTMSDLTDDLWKLYIDDPF